MKKPLLAATLTVIIAAPAAPMTLPYPYASEWTQIAVLARMVMQVEQTAQMIRTQIDMWRHMGIQGKLLTAFQMEQVGQSLYQLSKNIHQGQGLAYTLSHLDTAFRLAYPGYLQRGVAFNTQYSAWNKTNLDTIAGILASIGTNAQQLSSDASILNFVQEHAQTAVGQNQILQAGDELASFNAVQLMKLRQVMIAQTSAILTAQGRQINNEQVGHQILQDAIGPGHFEATN